MFYAMRRCVGFFLDVCCGEKERERERKREREMILTKFRRENRGRGSKMMSE